MTVIELIRLLADQNPDDRVEIRFREGLPGVTTSGLADLVCKVSRGGFRAVAIVADEDPVFPVPAARVGDGSVVGVDSRPNGSKRRSRKKARAKKRAKGRAK